MTDEEKVRRGQNADQLLKSGVFSNVLEALEAEYAEAWKATRPDDKDGRERIYNMVQLIADQGRLLTKWQGEAVFIVKEHERRKQAT